MNQHFTPAPSAQPKLRNPNLYRPTLVSTIVNIGHSFIFPQSIDKHIVALSGRQNTYEKVFKSMNISLVLV